MEPPGTYLNDRADGQGQLHVHVCIRSRTRAKSMHPCVCAHVCVCKVGRGAGLLEKDVGDVTLVLHSNVLDNVGVVQRFEHLHFLHQREDTLRGAAARPRS
jgi:hypothetical protein